MSHVVELVGDQAEAEAKDVHDGNRVWATGWIEAGNKLIEALALEVEDLAMNLKNKDSLPDLGKLLNLEDFPGPRE